MVSPDADTDALVRSYGSLVANKKIILNGFIFVPRVPNLTCPGSNGPVRLANESVVALVVSIESVSDLIEGGELVLPDGVTIEDLDGVADAAVLETPIITDIWTNLSPYESLAPVESNGRGTANMIFLRETGEATVILLTTVDATDSVDRDMTGIFAGIRTGAVSWLLEFDQITDSQTGMPDREQDPVFIEANWLIPQGHYLKLGVEIRSGDQFEDLDQTTLEYQWFPLQHTHFRFGYRDTQSDNAVFFANQSTLYSQIHVSL